MDSAECRWSDFEFHALELADQRLEDRLRFIASRCVRRGFGCINAVFDGAEREAAYRLVENHRVKPEAIIEACAAAAIARLKTPLVVVVLDQTTISVKDAKRIRGLGRVGAVASTKVKRGVEVMTGLALDEDGHVLGLVSQEWFLRAEERSSTIGSDKRHPIDRESSLWVRAMSSATTSIRRHCNHANPRIVFVMDRGGDFYALFHAANMLGVELIVRSAHDRRLVGADHLHDVVERTRIAGSAKRMIRRKTEGDRYVENEERVNLRFAEVTLDLHTMTGAKRGTSTVSVVNMQTARRRNQICWQILTTLKVKSLESALAIIDRYCSRWRIEDFHRGWKGGGCNVEKTQLRSLDAIKRWATILAAVAARAERLKTLSRTQPDRPALEEFTVEEIEALRVMTNAPKNHHPKNWAAPTLGEVVILIAYKGGWGGRSQGPAGTKILGRGLERIIEAAEVIARVRKQGLSGSG
jgi:hypothetical protein